MSGRKRFGSLVAVTAAALLVGLLGARSGAQEDEEGVVSYREKLMKANGASMGSIGDIMKYKLPYSTDHIAAHARIIHEASRLIPEAFEKKVVAGEAKPEIWNDWDGFVAAAKALEAESAKLAEIAGGGDASAAMAQVRALGNACRGCHDKYRKQDEEK